jgi:beta-glucosidase
VYGTGDLIMKTSLMILLFGMMLYAASPGSNEVTRKTIDAKVAELLSKMTLEEKVGQMTQITLEVISTKQGTKDQMHVLNDEGLKDAVLKYHVGSILNVYDAAHSVDYWHEIITKIQNLATKESRLKIPVLYGIDAIHGANYTINATLFPQAISMAATFNTELSKQCGDITSKEVRASGIPWNFYPVLDVGRQVLWPRFWETYGEDTYLTSVMGVNYIEGAQGDDFAAKDKVAICLKHYVGYSAPQNGKDRTPAFMSERTLREYYLPPFEAAVKAGALTVMVNSSEIDGIPVHSDHHIISDILKGEMNFQGFVVSDWEDIKRLYTRDHVASSPEEAVKMAVLAGIDMSMIPKDYSFYTILLDLVKKNEVPISRIDDAVTRILRVKMMTGILDKPYPDTAMKELVGAPQHTAVNLQAAEESIVMTKNAKGILPLKKGQKILVTGPTANLLSVLNGGWTITWQGNEESLYPKQANTVVKALRQKFGEKNIIYSEGTAFSKDINIAETIKLAKKSDVIVLCLGEKAYCETPGNIDELTLDTAQLQLASKLAELHKPVVLVMLEGRPRIIRSIVDKVDAVLVGMLPGMKGGDAIANIIAGDAVPSAKLPFTYPKYSNSLYHYDYKPLEGEGGNVYDPQWAFGYGLSFTTYEYSDLQIDKKAISKTDTLYVSVNVKNTGKVSGGESVLLYLRDLYGSVSRPVRQLRGFQKIHLNPGEVKQVRFAITNSDLSFIGRENKRITESGDFLIMVDNLSAGFTLK